MAYWAFSFSGGEAEFTTMATPPSHIPCFMSKIPIQMSFYERMLNTAIKFFWQRPFIMVQIYSVDQVIAKYFPTCPSSSFLIADLNGAMINTNFVLDIPRDQSFTSLMTDLHHSVIALMEHFLEGTFQSTPFKEMFH